VFSTEGGPTVCCLPSTRAHCRSADRGEQNGKGRWYKEFVPIADTLYDEQLETLRREGLLNS
jgi:hypothetical protein